MSEKVLGILLLYSHPLQKNATTIMEHINAFKQYSRYSVYPINLFLGFPKLLNNYSFSVILLHYSLFGSLPFAMTGSSLDYVIKSRNSTIIAFFQDEYRFCQERITLINKLGIQCIYTLLESEFHEIVYKNQTLVTHVIYTIPGYVSEQLNSVSKIFLKPDHLRTIDIGYRTREIPAYLGLGGLEKNHIGKKFLGLCKTYKIHCDIQMSEQKRIYGNNWYKFFANCKGVIGVEAGASIFDLTGDVYRVYMDLNQGDDVAYEELNAIIDLKQYEEKISYRMISPRHFEAAALKVCQILFEGHYSGILQPMVHYIPLKKDFSNISEVMAIFQNGNERQRITEKAYVDLIQSDKFSYKKFIGEFDQMVQDNRYISEDFSVNMSSIEDAITNEVRKLFILAHIKEIIRSPLKYIVWLFKKTFFRKIAKNRVFNKTS